MFLLVSPLLPGWLTPLRQLIYQVVKVPPKRELFLQKEGMLRVRLLKATSKEPPRKMVLLKVRMLNTSITNIISEQAWLDIY
jgi:hypothetical protein